MSIKDSVLSTSQKETILRDIWIAHDGRWFLKSAGKQRFISWLEALDLNGTVSNSSDTNNCNGTCEYAFNIQW